jgi:hypothetical protein
MINAILFGISFSFDVFKAIPYGFLIFLNIFSNAFHGMAKKNFENTLQDMKTIPSNTIAEYVKDWHIRLTLISSTAATIIYAICLGIIYRKELLVPPWAILLVAIGSLLALIFMFAKFPNLPAGRLVEETNLGILKASWLNLYLIILNIALIIMSSLFKPVSPSG